MSVPQNRSNIISIGQPPPGKKQNVEIKLNAIHLMISGLKGEYHVNKHQLKLQKYPFDAGIDLYPLRTAPEWAEYGTSIGRFTVHTGVVMVVPPAMVGLITGRSSSHQKLLGAHIIAAKIDTGYCGEILIQIACPVADKITVMEAIATAAHAEQALAQMTLLSYAVPIFAVFDQNAPFMQRGTNGFGSTDSTDSLILKP